ncbi:phosphate transport system substrate-binding protein [Microbacterium marinum]|uniref:Phosphate transport system substrate-binding protein n=1 Tax=Microbacterium marinum TaxID=421115 RepID=A0A7W7FIR7_9MICO|nr:phosphate transport system substrate-binding protein [Microbacterium marinum]
MIRRPRRLPVRGALVALIVGVMALIAAVPAQAVDYDRISGSGSTWSQNALDQWRRNVANNYGMTVNFSGTGSSAGRRDFISGTVDYAVSEIPFQRKPEDGSAPEVPGRDYAYMPIVAGGTAFMYHLKINGKRVTNLRLSGDVIAKIFAGDIKNWKDPVIQADNPGLVMPDKKITPVVRSDGSGSTAQFTKWMSEQYPSIWSTGMTSQFPTQRVPGAKGQNGSLGVAGYVSQNYGEGAITYVEYSYALKSGFPVAKVLNKAGYYVEPTAQAVAVALLKAKINTDEGSADYLTQILDGVYNNGDARSYPLSSYSYMIVPTEVGGVFTAKKGFTLGEFTKYVVCDGQQQAAALGYSPLPMNLVMASFDQIKRIPGADAASLNLSACKNPTFKAGDSPATNQLAVSAPQPAACDKKGDTQCETPTAGANPGAGNGGGRGGSGSGTGGTGSTGGGTGGTGSGAGSGSGSSSGGSDAGGSGTSGSGTDTSGGDSGAAGGEAPVYDANGGLVSGGGTGGEAAVSSPFTLASSGWGPAQTGMLIAGGMLLAVVLLPPLVAARRRADR